MGLTIYTDPLLSYENLNVDDEINPFDPNAKYGKITRRSFMNCAECGRIDGRIYMYYGHKLIQFYCPHMNKTCRYFAVRMLRNHVH